MKGGIATPEIKRMESRPARFFYKANSSLLASREFLALRSFVTPAAAEGGLGGCPSAGSGTAQQSVGELRPTPIQAQAQFTWAGATGVWGAGSFTAPHLNERWWT